LSVLGASGELTPQVVRSSSEAPTRGHPDRSARVD
jgi:hypothetical protein